MCRRPPAGSGWSVPRRICLDFLHTDPLARTITVPYLADRAPPWTGRVVTGRTETGRPWLLRLLDRHTLVAGVSDTSKSILRALDDDDDVC